MIPPADSLLKYDTPVLVSRNTEKRSPKVRTGLRGRGSPEAPMGKDPCDKDPGSRETWAAATGSKGNWDGGRKMGERHKKRRWVTPESRFRMRKEVTKMDGAHSFS